MYKHPNFYLKLVYKIKLSLFSVAGTFFAYFSIVIVNFGDFSRYAKSENDLKLKKTAYRQMIDKLRMEHELEEKELKQQFKDAMKKIISQDDTPLTAEEIKVIAKRSDYIKNNTMLYDALSKSTGGTDILSMLIGETDIKKKALIIKNIQNFAQENPADFPLLFQAE